MNKQTSPTIKAHLIRGAFYLLLLIAIRAIPFALAQRNATTRVVDNAAQATPTLCDTGIIQNGGFESGTLPPWGILSAIDPPKVTDYNANSGAFSAVAGDTLDGDSYCDAFELLEPLGDSSFYQEFTVPAGTSTLSFWHRDCGYDDGVLNGDWQAAYITDTFGTILQTIFQHWDNNNYWDNETVDMTAYAGQTVRVEFLVHEDGEGGRTSMFVDDVQLLVPCGTPSPTPTPTPTPTFTPGPHWEYTGSLNTARRFHTATLLSDGRVLVAGGYDGNGLASAELYDPATATWTLTGSLNIARHGHTATLLQNGLVLVAGGRVSTIGGDGPTASVELYDPATGTWTETGSLNQARSDHTATLLYDGRVLVVGWQFDNVPTAELYDPTTGTWTVTGSLNTPRISHTATLLSNGKVLVAGGLRGAVLASAELYDPATGTWTVTGSLNTARIGHTATLLPNGDVLAAAGVGFDGFLASAELYDPMTGTWTETGSLNHVRYLHTAMLLTNGKVLAAGGYDINFVPLASAELYDPTTGSWTFTGSLNAVRASHTATLLSNGEVLAAAGLGNDLLASAELYEPGIGVVQGGGTIDNQGNQVSFKFRANQSDVRRAGDFSVCDPATGVCTTKGRIQNLSIVANTAEFNGQARLEDGTDVRFSVSVTDNGDPGTSDTISISLSNGYSVSGTLTSGDIRIR